MCFQGGVFPKAKEKRRFTAEKGRVVLGLGCITHCIEICRGLGPTLYCENRHPQGYQPAVQAQHAPPPFRPPPPRPSNPHPPRCFPAPPSAPPPATWALWNHHAHADALGRAEAGRVALKLRGRRASSRRRAASCSSCNRRRTVSRKLARPAGS